MSRSPPRPPAPPPLADMPTDGLDGLLTDVDDTLTTEGRLHASAYRALERLHESGLEIVPVTGRSSCWSHMILKTGPVAAGVAVAGFRKLTDGVPTKAEKGGY